MRGLEQAAVPLVVVNSNTAKQADCDDVAAALSDRATVTHYECVRGLERRVVVGVGGALNDRLHTMSRCNGLLLWVDTPAKN